MSGQPKIVRLYKISEAADVLTDLLDNAAHINTLSKACIYFLLYEGEVVYVGQSTSVYARLQAHRIDPRKKWDAYVIHEVDAKDMDAIELHYYEQLRPRYNKAIPVPPNRKKRQRRKYMPLSLV